MRYLVAITLLLPLAGLAQGKYIHKGERDGVEMAYRWNHPTGKPSELLLRLKNTTQEDRRIALAIDLYYQGRTVEVLESDTCIRAGQSMTGKLNGVYFVPEQLTTEQIKSGDAEAELTRTLVTIDACP